MQVLPTASDFSIKKVLATFAIVALSLWAINRLPFLRPVKALVS